MKAAALILSLLVSPLMSCAGSRHADGPELAGQAGWRWEVVAAGPFDLAVASAPGGAGDTLAVYLEGDGFAYVGPRRPSLDPTPTDPMALRMALAHPGRAAVAWLGRPCQYTLPEHGRGCGEATWTTARYGPAVVDSMNTALDILKRRAGAAHLILAGYSGGGALAVLLAARRSDVEGIVTIAANLDLGYWTRRDGLSPLSGSLDPEEAAEALGAMPQIHFTGAKDDTVGTDVVAAFMRRLPEGTPARLVEIPGFTHACCWVRDWPALAADLAVPGW